LLAQLAHSPNHEICERAKELAGRIQAEDTEDATEAVRRADEPRAGFGEVQSSLQSADEVTSAESEK
jgi:hypothetical protein